MEKITINGVEYKLTPVENESPNSFEAKFNVGDWCRRRDGGFLRPIKITKVLPLSYEAVDDIGYHHSIVKDCFENNYRLWTIEDSKAGDVLATKAGGIFVYKELLYDEPFAYCGVDKFGDFKDCNCGNGLYWTPYLSNVTPATKEQRDLLFTKMKEVGYEWYAEKKELKKIEDEEYNGEDYGIDSLYHAQRILEKTLGKVSGYQTDDGILSHKCAITAVKKLYEQKSTEWSEDDKKIFDEIIGDLEALEINTNSEGFSAMYKKEISWLKSIRPQKQWKPSDEQMKTLDAVRHNNSFNVSILDSLFHDLKKLKE